MPRRERRVLTKEGKLKLCNMFLVGTVILLSLFVGIFMPILAIKCFEKGFYINTGEKVDVTSEMKPFSKQIGRAHV